MTIQSTPFGKTKHGQPVTLYTITNKGQNAIRVIDYGAILVSVEVPDRNGRRTNVNLGYPNIDSYLTRHPYFGSTVGRFCNRIALGKFSLDGKEYKLAVNNGPNHLHGGIIGFDQLMWKASLLEDTTNPGIRFDLLSPDGDEGYPGNLSATAIYRWNDANELMFHFEATTDKPTVVNLTNHAYWNLAGAGNGTIHQHQLTLQCDNYLEVDGDLIPTGKIATVAGTALDFRKPTAIGDRIDQYPATKGYDHCYVVNGTAGELRMAAHVVESGSGRTMDVLTTQPGMQLYTGNHLSGDFPQHAGFCLETQHYPDAPNKPHFPSTRLDPGQRLSETTIHRFGIA